MVPPGDALRDRNPKTIRHAGPNDGRSHGAGVSLGAAAKEESWTAAESSDGARDRDVAGGDANSRRGPQANPAAAVPALSLAANLPRSFS